MNAPAAHTPELGLTPQATPQAPPAREATLRGPFRPTPVSQRGPHWRTSRLLKAQLLALLVASALVGGWWALLAGVVVVALTLALHARRGDWLDGSDLVLRRLRTRRIDLSTVREASLRAHPGGDHRVVDLVVTDQAGHTAAVTVWRTRPPRGVSPFAGEDLARAMPHAPREIVSMLRAQSWAVRHGVRPTPLDRWVDPQLADAHPDPRLGTS